MASSAERDIRRAADLRKLKKGVKDPDALRAIDSATGRLERNAARKLGKIGKKPKMKGIRGSKAAGPLV